MSENPTRPVPTPSRFQFGIRRLLVVTTIVAILCSFAVCTHWIVAVTLGAIVLMAWIVATFVASPLVRNSCVILGAISIVFALDFLVRRCNMESALGPYEAMFWPVLYFSIVWANWRIVREDRSRWLKWSARVLLSALLLPLYAVIIVTSVLCFELALGIPILHS
jgi:hypothetical protein